MDNQDDFKPGLVPKLIEKALRTWNMIREGDRILLAVSGGKDSIALACDLAMKRRWWPAKYELAAVQVISDFTEIANLDATAAIMEKYEIPFERIHVPVAGRLKPGRTLSCYWCSTQRRTELVRYAVAHGYGKLALGHHLDDAIETLFMNMMHDGHFATMPPVIAYRKWPVTVIRPLELCEERQIVEYIKFLGFEGATCTCEWNTNSFRKQTRKAIETLTGGSSRIKRNIFASMSNYDPEYLP